METGSVPHSLSRAPLERTLGRGRKIRDRVTQGLAHPFRATTT
jgi:hypothetical protein